MGPGAFSKQKEARVRIFFKEAGAVCGDFFLSGKETPEAREAGGENC